MQNMPCQRKWENIENICPHSSFHPNTHVLRGYTDKEKKILPTELVFNQPFQNSYI